MTSPTRRLLDRAEAVLEEPVGLAVRVRQGPQQRSLRPKEATDPVWPARNSPPRSFPVVGLPILPLLRSLRWAITDSFIREDVVKGILAFTRSGDRVLLGRSRFNSLRPTEAIRRLPGQSPLTVDLALLYDDLLPELEIDGERYLVNAVDFGVLTRAVVTGEFDAPKLAEQLRPYYQRVQELVSQDPRSVRALIRDQGSTI